MRAFLSGDGDTAAVGVRVGKFDYYVFALYGENGATAVRDYISAMSGADDLVADMSNGIIAFCKKVDNDSDYQSAGEFAVVLSENLAEEIKEKIRIGVGGVAHGGTPEVLCLCQIGARARRGIRSEKRYIFVQGICAYKNSFRTVVQRYG